MKLTKENSVYIITIALTAICLFLLAKSFIYPDLEMSQETIWEDRWEILIGLIIISSTGIGYYLIKKNKTNTATKEKLIGALLGCFGFALMGLTILLDHRKITKKPVEITYFMSSLILLLSVFGFIVILKKIIKKEY